MDVNSSLCFVITMKYFRQVPTYIQIYVKNIQKFYDNAFILIVDNNSDHVEDIQKIFSTNNNVKIITNDSKSKYELGGHIFGMDWLIKNDMVSKYRFFIFTQDTLILTNKYDFNILRNNNIIACPLIEHNGNSYVVPETGKVYLDDERRAILEPLGLYNNMDKMTLCWGCNYICKNEKLIDLFNYVKDIVLINKKDSETSERYMIRILYELNNHSFFNIDGWVTFGTTYDDYFNRNPNIHKPEFDYDNKLIYFQKKHQYNLNKK